MTDSQPRLRAWVIIRRAKDSGEQTSAYEGYKSAGNMCLILARQYHLLRKNNGG